MASCARLLLRTVHRQYLLLVAWGVTWYILYRWAAGEQSPVGGTAGRHLLLQRAEMTPAAVQLEQLMTLVPLVDTSPALSERQLFTTVQKEVPNLPMAFFDRRRGRVSQMNSTCAKLPILYDLKLSNIYWQVLETSNGSYHFYSAYYDNRVDLPFGPLVRILVMIDRIKPSLKTYCQLWFDRLSFPLIVPVLEYKYLWYEKWGNYEQGILQPYIMACRIPPAFQFLVPQAVTVVERPCDSSTVALRIINNRPPAGEKRQDFAVCVKGLSFPEEDISVRLVEWLELLRLLGAKKVFMYELEVHANISKVLRYYESRGLVELTPLTLAGEQPNLSPLQALYLRRMATHRRQSELVPYNDCFYRNLYRYEHVALLDTDEVIMPLRHSSWAALMEEMVPRARRQAEKKHHHVASYNTRNVYFFDSPESNAHWQAGIPRYMHMLQHTKRSRNHTDGGQYVKCFHRTDRVVALHNHFPLACLGGCISYSINKGYAQLQHYRADCVGPLKTRCESEYKRDSVEDTTIWRYKDELTARTTRTLVDLGFLPPEGSLLAEHFSKASVNALSDTALHKKSSTRDTTAEENRELERDEILSWMHHRNKPEKKASRKSHDSVKEALLTHEDGKKMYKGHSR